MIYRRAHKPLSSSWLLHAISRVMYNNMQRTFTYLYTFIQQLKAFLNPFWKRAQTFSLVMRRVFKSHSTTTTVKKYTLKIYFFHSRRVLFFV